MEVENNQRSEAGIWTRFFARNLDATLIILVMGSLLCSALYSISPYFYYKIVSNTDYSYSLYLFLFPFYLIFDAFICSAFGNNVGNAIAGIKILKVDGGVPSFKRYLKRNISIWVKGYGFCLPIVNLVTLSSQYSSLKGGGKTSWDYKYSTIVVNVRNNPFRTSICAIFFLIVFCLNIFERYNENTNNSQNNYETELDNSFKSNEKFLPKRLDDYTVLYDEKREGNVIFYKYYFEDTSGTKIHIPVDRADEAKLALRKMLSKSYCSSIGLRKLGRAGYKLIYDYTGADPESSFSIEISEGDCNH